MKRAAAAAAATLVAVTALSGAAATPGSATESDAKVYSKKLVLNATGSHQLGKRTFAGTDRIRSAARDEVAGYASYTGKFYQRTETAVIQGALALKGGIIVIRVRLTDSPRFDGRILKGSGKYQGVDGTVTGREGDSGKVFLKLRYRL